MNVLRILLQLSVLVSLIFLAAFAQAHKIRVFAYENDGEIVAEAKFSSGRPAKAVRVEVQDKSEAILVTGETDQKGEYRFSKDILSDIGKGDLRIIVDDGSGHRGFWILAENDYRSKQSDHSHLESTQPASTPETQAETSNISSGSIDYQVLNRLIEQAVAREIAPIQKMLVEQSQDKITLQDILGGLGYILGLAGVAALYKSKRR